MTSSATNQAAPPSGNSVNNRLVSPQHRLNSLNMTSTDLSGGDGTSAGSDPTTLQGQGQGHEPEDEVLKTEELPAPDTPAGTREAFLKSEIPARARSPGWLTFLFSQIETIIVKTPRQLD